jgi:glutaredoxin
MTPQIERLLKEIEDNKDKKITIYTLESCPACIELKRKLDKINVVYENVDMKGNDAMWKQLENMGGSEYVPQVEVEGYLIKENEYDNINELISETLTKVIGRKIIIKS